MKIYTKTGDQGQTKLVDGIVVSKSNLRVSAYGTVDELNSYIGLIVSLLQENNYLDIKSQLTDIQNNLFVIGSLLATENSKVIEKLPGLTTQLINNLESRIDVMTSQLQPLREFILPTGHVLAAHTHVARTICRRAERTSVEIFNQNIKTHDLHNQLELCLQYLNRLSDYLFTLARYFNHLHQVQDTPWKKK
ncbi:MAG: cob(I)yrinic acid a,c-diamide adenosyltransferase [Pseudobdellovibrio sp.]